MITAQDFFAAKLAYECDPADVAAEVARGDAHYAIVDCRSRAAYEKAHIPGAISLPHADMTPDTVAALPEGPLVTYCWGPGCNAATKGALALTALGRDAREMIGGFEYWVREGNPVEGRARGRLAYAADTTGLVVLQPG